MARLIVQREKNFLLFCTTDIYITLFTVPDVLCVTVDIFRSYPNISQLYYPYQYYGPFFTYFTQVVPSLQRFQLNSCAQFLSVTRATFSVNLVLDTTNRVFRPSRLWLLVSWTFG
jgi:hypothetical protein